MSGLVAIDGVLYGLWWANYGTVYSLTPPVTAGGTRTEAVLYTFAGCSDGENPQFGNLVAGARRPVLEDRADLSRNSPF